MITQIADNSNYSDLFLVFPITKPFSNIQRVITGKDFESVDPLVLFI